MCIAFHIMLCLFAEEKEMDMPVKDAERKATKVSAKEKEAQKPVVEKSTYLKYFCSWFL